LLRYFRINDPYRLLAILVLLIIIYLPLFLDPVPITTTELQTILVGETIANGNQMYTGVVDNTAPLAAWSHALTDMIFGRSLMARHIIAFLIIFFQSAYLGIIFITKKVFNENTFIPSLIFSVLFFFSFDTLELTDELMGSGFLLLAINNLFKEIEFRAPRDETTFNLGIYISLASLFYFPYVTFVFGTLVILFLFARATARKFLLFLFGFALPHLLVLSISYLNGSASQIWKYYYGNNLAFGADFIVSTKGLFILCSVIITYLVVSVVMLNRLARFSKYQSQTLQTIFLWIGFCFIYFLFCKELRPQTLTVLIPPVTFLFTHFLLLIRRRRFAEMNIWILLIGIVSLSYMARYNKLSGVNYTRLFVSEEYITGLDQKKILVLGDEMGFYLNNTPGTPFIDWELAEDIFRHPEYYESLTVVYDALKNGAPDVIIDKENLMQPFLERIPEFRKQYSRQGIAYWRINN